jgi:hypothetical protein
MGQGSVNCVSNSKVDGNFKEVVLQNDKTTTKKVSSAATIYNKTCPVERVVAVFKIP